MMLTSAAAATMLAAAAGAVAFHRTAAHAFVHDDRAAIVHNPDARWDGTSPWADVLWRHDFWGAPLSAPCVGGGGRTRLCPPTITCAYPARSRAPYLTRLLPALITRTVHTQRLAQVVAATRRGILPPRLGAV